MSISPRSHVSDLSSLVFNFQARSLHHPDDAGGLFDEIRRIALRVAPRDFRSRDLIDDVVSHALELLYRRPIGHFDPDRGSAEDYLALIVRTSVRDVRDENQVTPARRRDYTEQSLDDVVRPPVEPTYELESDLALELDLADRLAGRPELMIAVTSIAFDDLTVVDAAAGSGMTRFQVVRQLRRLFDRRELAA